MTARSDRDLTPESIVQKVSDASGSKYAGAGSAPNAAGPPPPVSSKPAFTPTRSSAGGGFNPLISSRARSTMPKDTNVDEDGWGADAPPVTRTQLEKVQSSYQPTKINMRELSAKTPESTISSRNEDHAAPNTGSEVVKGGYQPIGKVDIASLRKQAQTAGRTHDDRPTAVKGSYEPVGKVDIAAIRARAQQAPEGAPFGNSSPASTDATPSNQSEESKSLPDRSAPSSHSERLTSLPKPKVGSRFGASASSFTGTKAPIPGNHGLESKAPSTTTPTGVGRTFADQGGKTPAQLWAEKKARERGLSGANEDSPAGAMGSAAAPITAQSSGGGEWRSGYGGKSWAPVQTSRTGRSSSNVSQQQHAGQDNEDEDGALSQGNVGAIRDRFKDAPPMGTNNKGISSPPPLETSSKPNAGRGISLPGLPARPSQPAEEEASGAQTLPSPPPQPPRSPTPPTPPAMDSGSPVRIAMPVSRGHNEQDIEDASEEQFSPAPAMPARSLAQVVPHEDDLTEESTTHDPARAAGEAAAATSFRDEVAEPVHPEAQDSCKRALVQFDYEKAEDNELELREGDYVTNIEMVDDDWWMGQNTQGETGLFPSNYVELVEAEGDAGGESIQPEPTHPTAGATVDQGATATALYDYEAAEGNELSFPENAKITGVVSVPIPNIMTTV